ncbi:response regulator [Aquimarina sp. D1M17]|nr:response regulator [Aquimarina acroporae]
MLEKANIVDEILIAKDGQEALQILNNPYFADLILLDINMPVMDGWEFLNEFQKLDAAYKDVGIIVMIGVDLPHEKKELIKKIPNVKGCSGKMLSKQAIIDILAKLQDDTLMTQC